MIERVLRCWKENGFKYTLVKLCTKLGGPFRKLLLIGYYGDIRNRLNQYESAYGDHSKKTALRLVWWNFKQLFKIHIRELPQASRDYGGISDEDKVRLRRQKKLMDENLNIAFRIDGGFGDFLIFANYLCYLKKRFPNPCVRFDVYFVKGLGYSKLLFGDKSLCSHCYQYDDEDGNLEIYDVSFFLSRYPEVRHFDARAVMEFEPAFLDYILLCEQFKEENRRFFDRLPECDGQSAVFSAIRGQSRLQQPDVYGFLGIGREYCCRLNIEKDEDKCLAGFGLRKRGYVILHYGCDTAYSTSVKMWPHRYYSELAGMIKKEFPQLTVVQCGVNQKKCPPMKNVDVNIVGKTSMEDIAVLLKHSVLLVDCESGMIHLRRALDGGVSVSLHGPTSVDFFGYEGNIKLTGNGCPESCEWLTGDWMLVCSAGFSEPPCMASITPEIAMDAMRTVLRNEGAYEIEKIS